MRIGEDLIDGPLWLLDRLQDPAGRLADLEVLIERHERRLVELDAERQDVEDLLEHLKQERGNVRLVLQALGRRR